MVIRILREDDSRSDFNCSDPDLDRYFKKYAGQNQFRHYLGVTYVALERGRIIAYVTVSIGSIEVDSIPDAVRKKFPKYPIPILRLARLAVDERAQGQGVGKQLVKFVLTLSSAIADNVGCAGVVVDAKTVAVDFYRKLGFETLEVLEGGSDMRPRPTLMFLPMRAIKSAIGSSPR